MTKRLLTALVLLAGLIAGQTALAAAFDLPLDVQKLMPADPTAVFAVSSVDELIARYETISKVFDQEKEFSRADLLADLEKEWPGFGSEVRLDRPLFAVAGLPDLMSGGNPPFMLILPLTDAAAGADSLQLTGKFAASFRRGGYVALGADPTLVPGDGAVDLARHLPAGVITATLDLTGVVTAYRPFVEMGLAGIPIRDESSGLEDTKGMTAEEAAALSTTIRQALDAVTRLDLSFGQDGDLLTMHTGLGVAPGSALDPGPQPDFARALALTGALRQDADFLQVIALDQTRVFAAFRDYYLLSMKNALQGMDAEQSARYSAWVEDYIDHMDLWANPMAAALTLSDDAMAGQLVMETPDAAAGVAHFAQTLGGMSDLGIGCEVTRAKDQRIAGVDFQVWHVAIDLEKLEAAMPDSHGPAMSGSERMQAEQLISIMQRIMPVIYLGAKGDKLFMASDDDTDRLAALVKNTERTGNAVEAVTAVADKAGPGCQQVITGDLIAIINWVSGLMAELNDGQAAVVADNPIPFQADFVIEGADFGFDMGMDLPALGNLMRAMEELKALEDKAEPESEQ